MELTCSSPLSVNSTISFNPQLRRYVSAYPHKRCQTVFSLFPYCPSSSSHITTTTATTATSSSTSSFCGISLSHRPCNSIPRKIKRSLYIVSGVFERFTERSIKAVMFSQKEAKALGKDMVYTQHLLLGLIAEDRSPGGFLGSRITIDKAREAVRSIWHDDVEDDKAKLASQDSGSATSATDVAFSSSTKRVFEAAVEYSRTMGHNFIAPEHIAFGLFTVDDGNATRVLKRYYR